MTVENEWHGFDRARHDRIHPNHDDRDCLMCVIEGMGTEITTLKTDLDAVQSNRDAFAEESARFQVEIDRLKKRVRHVFINEERTFYTLMDWLSMRNEQLMTFIEMQNKIGELFVGNLEREICRLHDLFTASPWDEEIDDLKIKLAQLGYVDLGNWIVLPGLEFPEPAGDMVWDTFIEKSKKLDCPICGLPLSIPYIVGNKDEKSHASCWSNKYYTPKDYPYQVKITNVLADGSELSAPKVPECCHESSGLDNQRSRSNKPDQLTRNGNADLPEPTYIWCNGCQAHCKSTREILSRCKSFHEEYGCFGCVLFTKLGDICSETTFMMSNIGRCQKKKDCNEVGAPDPCASEHSILVSEIMPNFILVKKCGQLRKLSTMTRMEMDNDTESIFYEIDQSDCNKKCDSYYRCAGVYACGYLLREDEVIKRIDDKGDKQHGKNNI